MSATGGRRTRRGRAGGDPSLTIIRWRDIPVQVTARHGDQQARAELPRTFTRAVDRTAMAEGLAGTDAYLDQWARSSRPCGRDLSAAVDDEVARLVADHPRDVLEAIVANGGRRHGDAADPTDQPASTGTTT